MDKFKQQGFTLIELVMVIVILGILAAVALPKFANLGGDARSAALQGAYGAVNSAIAITHSQALVSNQTGATGTITLEGGNTVAMVYGYPKASADGIEKAVSLSGGIAFTTAGTKIGFSSGVTTAANCEITYAQASESSGVVTPASASLPATINCN